MSEKVIFFPHGYIYNLIFFFKISILTLGLNDETQDRKQDPRHAGF